MQSLNQDGQPIFTVSQLNIEAKSLLEKCFNQLWITGEVSNLARPHSGHIYFSLKDQDAQIRCAFFKHHAQRLSFPLENGQEVIASARVSLYEARGDYQLIIQNLQLAGEGALQIEFEKLKQKLAQAGLFDPSHKKPLPSFPRTVGVITSASGAAVRDILKVLERRCVATSIIIYPTMVQGKEASQQIVDAIETANRRKECNVLLLARGGGSLEDLWPFNTEDVARAIFQSEIPLVTGIGHEIDFTIADFVADQRAATPSAAAELVSPSLMDWQIQLTHLLQRLRQRMQRHLEHAGLLIENLEKRLRHPQQQLHHYADSLLQIEERLILSMQHYLQHQTQKFEHIAAQLNAISPLRTLNRGYAIAVRDRDQTIIRDAATVSPNEKITLRLAQGQLSCRVTPPDSNTKKQAR